MPNKNVVRLYDRLQNREGSLSSADRRISVVSSGQGEM